MNGKVKQRGEDKPAGQAQAITTQNGYALLQTLMLEQKP